MNSLAERIKRKAYSWLGAWRPDLFIEPTLFDGFRDEVLKELAPEIRKTRFFREMPGVVGWLSPRERQVLYALARWLPGPFLEIGSWVGLSTSHIATGIRDSGQRKQFIAAELNPTPANFRPEGDGYGFYYPPDSSESMGVCTASAYRDEIEPILKSPGGVLGTLRRNLERQGLGNLVTIHEGHFSSAPKFDYKFIFCDAMHEPEEIERNATHLRPLLKPGVLLACHDLNCHPDNEAALRRTFSYGHTLVVDTLLIGEIA